MYKIFCTTWHVMHYWDLFNALKGEAEFYLVDNNHRGWRSKAFVNSRPIPENAHFVPYYEKGKYDFAILNVDQQVANPALGKSKLFMELHKLIQDIPKVIINHATPVYPEFFLETGMKKPEDEDVCRKLIRSLYDGYLPVHSYIRYSDYNKKETTPANIMIVNSHKAKDEWGWGYPIWHGMNKDEWYDLPKEPRVFTALSPSGCDEYYNREMMKYVRSKLSEIYGYELYWARENINTGDSPEYYKEFMGRSLIYLDTSFRTPMNRGRTEAMLSGCCVVQVKGAHDLERFAKDGENMVLVDNNWEKIMETVVDLIENRYDEAVKIGQAGKQTAIELFNRERYKKDWLDMIHNELGL